MSIVRRTVPELIRAIIGRAGMTLIPRMHAARHCTVSALRIATRSVLIPASMSHRSLEPFARRTLHDSWPTRSRPTIDVAWRGQLKGGGGRREARVARRRAFRLKGRSPIHIYVCGTTQWRISASSPGTSSWTIAPGSWGCRTRLSRGAFERCARNARGSRTRFGCAVAQAGSGGLLA